MIGGKEVGNELTLRVRRPHTVEGLQYQELRMGLWAEERTGMGAEGLPRGSLYDDVGWQGKSLVAESPVRRLLQIDRV